MAEPKHEAWKKVFEGLEAIGTAEIQYVLGVSMLTAGRLQVMASEYVMMARRKEAEAGYEGLPRPKTLPKFLPKEDARGVRQD
jgi:hypothetical protein